MTNYLLPAITEAEATSNVGRTFQPHDRVTSKYGTDLRVGIVYGNRYFGAGVYGVLVRMDGESSVRYLDAMNLRPAPVDLAECECCHWGFEPVELEPGPSGDLFCSDCLSNFHETSLYAY